MNDYSIWFFGSRRFLELDFTTLVLYTRSLHLQLRRLNNNSNNKYKRYKKLSLIKSKINLINKIEFFPKSI